MLADIVDIPFHRRDARPAPMLLYSLLDRVLPRSFLAKVLAVVVLCGQAPLMGVVALYGFGLLSPPVAWPALAAAFCVGLVGAATGLAAVLRPVARLEAALAAFERGETPVDMLPEGHGDEVGRLMRRAAALVRTTERRIVAAERQADRDPLTGLLNRRGFERALAARRALRERGALLMIDIDRFKAVNDTHGHDAGDRVLRDVAALLCEHMRRPDLAARFGGEEFVVYLSGLGREPALQIAERLRMAVEDRIAVAGNPQTASFGVTQWPVGVPFSDVLRLADAAVYAAKSNGRNCVRFAPAGRAAHRSRTLSATTQDAAADDGQSAGAPAARPTDGTASTPAGTGTQSRLAESAESADLAAARACPPPASRSGVGSAETRPHGGGVATDGSTMRGAA
jgi:diguanylate cyclase (GGDEF)-like protein